MQINAIKLNIPTLVIFLLLSMFEISCSQRSADSQVVQEIEPPSKEIIVGAERLDMYLPLLENKKVALVVNHSSFINQTHLVDSLLSRSVSIVKLFAPEHGFRGDLANGEHVSDGMDKKTGLPILSLHGKTKKPTPEMMEELDVVIFDIQEVGARFYTYLSTMHLVMEACAEANVPMIVLDRPNPNGHYVDGPVMEDAHKSFLGMHNIPIVHGMTLGELAQMINSEGWLTDSLKCRLKVISVSNWNHNTPYVLPIRPSPNLPNAKAINLYPSLCLFEQTIMSVGRGTDTPFTVLGHPQFPDTTFSFTPVSRQESKYPKHEGIKCFGENLIEENDLSEFSLSYLIEYYKLLNSADDSFFKKYFNRLAGTNELQTQIESGWTEEGIKATWQEDLKKFKQMRKKYLLYPDFE